MNGIDVVHDGDRYRISLDIDDIFTMARYDPATRTWIQVAQLTVTAANVLAALRPPPGDVSAASENPTESGV